MLNKNDSNTLFIYFLALLLATFVASTAHAQALMPSESHSSEQSSSSSSSQASEDEQGNLGLGEAIEERLLDDSWIASFNTLAESWGLSSSAAGRLLATVLCLILLFAVHYAVKFIVRKLVSSLNNSSKLSINAPIHQLNKYLKVVNAALFLCFVCAYIMIVCSIWSENLNNNFIFEKASDALGFLITFLLLFCLGCVVFEFAQSIFNRVFLEKWASSDSARDQTLLPIARNVVNVTLFIILGLTIVSELGINIMPVLASAGVLGFAIGFGAQTIVKDLLTGFIIIFEDLIQVGDVVTVGGKSGLVEKITIRKVQLRNLEGIVSTVPFSEISIVENMTKEFSYYVFDIGIAYRESPDEVITILRQISNEMKQEDPYKSLMLDDLEIMGLDKFADSAIIIKARIKTQPIKQWQVGREFNRRIKYRFDEAGIEIPFPHQTLYFGEDKQGKAPAANLFIRSKESANESSMAQDQDTQKEQVSSQDDTKATENKRKKSDNDMKDGYTDDDAAEDEIG